MGITDKQGHFYFDLKKIDFDFILTKTVLALLAPNFDLKKCFVIRNAHTVS